MRQARSRRLGSAWPDGPHPSGAIVKFVPQPVPESAPAPPPTWRTRVALPGYAVGTFVLGFALLAVVLFDQVGTVRWVSWGMAAIYLLAVLNFIGELYPLLVARRDHASTVFTLSTTFAVALTLIGPLSVALVTQALAVAIDDLRRKRPAIRTMFNVGQYLVTLTVTRVVFAGLAPGHGILDPVTSLGVTDVLPALAAAATYPVLNNGLVAGAIAMASNRGFLVTLREDVRAGGMAIVTLLALAPVTAVVANFSPFMLPLLILPLLGVQRTAWIASQRQLDALRDGLTGLPNRTLFRVKTGNAIEDLPPTGGVVGVMLLDLDHFKEVNDTLGHQVGDGVLREVATRVVGALPPDVTVARLGGDEFGVLVPLAAGLHEVSELAKRVTERLREPVMAEGVRVSVQTSIGIAVCPDHATTTDALLQRADIALYRAKGNRGDIEVYRTEIDQHTVLRLSLLGDLHTAVDHQEFELYFQPQVDTATGYPVGVEALMRWQHPMHGMIYPNVFIPLAENTGVIGAMSQAALHSALRTLGKLRRSGHDLNVAVNVSARLLSNLDLPAWVGQALMESGLSGQALTIEVTESTIAADPTRAMQVLHELRELGVRLAIDDFGTGYSSLSYLRRLQPDELKVDKSFVLQMRADENSAVIVRSTIELGHSLGMAVVAEGVEDQPTYDALLELGCDRIQGFHIARPMTATAVKVWLDQASLIGRAPVPARRPG
jgi:diguanylate cyclase (GGDEF)-like protein